MKSDWRPFEEARAFVRTLGLQGWTGWKAYCNSGTRPDDIPSHPREIYAEKFQGIDDWLGSACVTFLPFEEARAFVHTLGLQNRQQWRDYCKNGQKPANIPADPRTPYGSDYLNMGDWLGTNYVHNRLRAFRPFEEARAFVRGLGLKNLEEWKAYRKSGNKPADIPSNPNRTYKSEFKNMGDWLGTGAVATKERGYLPFEEARAFVRTLGLASGKAWQAYCASGEKPPHIPNAPRQVYAAFKSMPDWLGTSKRTPGRNFLPFEEARAFVRALGLRTSDDWLAYSRSEQRPSTIPTNPWTAYQGAFQGMRDWLGTPTIEYLPFEEARAFVQGLGLRTRKEWQDYCHSGQNPANIPSNPARCYGSSFQSIDDWLGTGRIAPSNRTFLPFEEARAFVRALGLKNSDAWSLYCTSGKKPTTIPANPAGVYGKDFLGMGDWLGVLNKWSRAALLALLQDLRPHLIDLEERELYIILQQAGALPALRLALGGVSPMQVLRDLVDCSGESIELALRNREGGTIEANAQISVPDDLLADVCLPVLDAGHLFEHDGSARLSLVASRVADGRDLDVVDMLARKGSIWLGQEAAEYLISNRVNALWERYMSEGHSVTKGLQRTKGGAFFKEIRRRFLDEVAEVEGLPIPPGWAFRDAAGVPVLPNAMQRRTAWLVRERRRVGNWSGTGAGKTLAAILSARVCRAYLTLVVTNFVTIDGWRRQILAAYPDSQVLYEVPGQACPPHSYLVLNYEQFQTGTRDLLVDELVALGPDLVVFDEVQLVKQRDSRASLRRQALESLIEGLSVCNPDLRVLGMSATPVINNLLEARKLLELITGISFSQDVKATVHNALAMHRLLMHHGFRFRPRYEQELRICTPTVVRNDLLAPLLSAHTSVLAIEQLLLPARLEAARPYLRRGTLLYTHYVEGMVEPICRFLGALGFSYGRYTGEEKAGLASFLDGKIDVLVGSSPVGTGLDGLQQVCDRVIILSLPWTGAAYEQVIGRVRRQGSRHGAVDIIVPQVMLEAGQESWSWDAGRMEVIQYKRTLSDCAIDGHIPETVRLHETMLLQRSREALEHWIAQAGAGAVREKEAVQQP